MVSNSAPSYPPCQDALPLQASERELSGHGLTSNTDKPFFFTLFPPVFHYNIRTLLACEGIGPGWLDCATLTARWQKALLVRPGENTGTLRGMDAPISCGYKMHQHHSQYENTKHK